MRVTRFTDYGLRVLIFVGLNEPRLCTIGEIAACYGISKNHLMKVVQELVARGYLKATRGRNGGVRLSAPASSISIGALVRDLERNTVLVECFNPEGSQCVITPACRLRSVFAEAHEAFHAVLDQYSLADLLPPDRREQLLRLIGADRPSRA